MQFMKTFLIKALFNYCDNAKFDIDFYSKDYILLFNNSNECFL